jgi:heme-degrading monooxygenase HmoA
LPFAAIVEELANPLGKVGERRTLRMPYMLVRHNVEDYEKWKPVFEEHGDTRRESGSKGVRLFRNADAPNETVILIEWEDLENARQFAQSEDLRETMERAGVAEQPDIYFLEEVDTVPA